MNAGNMVIVQLIGGLGNQMFQYASGLSLAKEKKAVLKIDSSSFSNYTLHAFDLEKWDVKIEKASPSETNELLKRKFFVLPNKKYRERGLPFNEGFFDLATPVYLEGYWQSEKYFRNIREEILKAYTPKRELSTYSKEILTKIRTSKTSVSVHVRRGDYLQAKNQTIHGVCTLDYYQTSILYFEDKYSEITFFVFSDDINWAKDNLKFNSNVIFVDGNGVERNHEDLYLMSNCNHNVIANSSFSWWGAWLNNFANKEVVAPKNWFVTTKHNASDIICKEWLRF